MSVLLPRMRFERGALAATVITLAVLFAAASAVAKISLNTIDAGAVMSDDGRHLVVTGPIACTAGERAHQRVIVTQRATGALAEGQTLVVCTGHLQQWEIHAAIQGRQTFQLGSATAVAAARTSERGETTDAHQWLVGITLVAQ
ncbi:MAG: hypothetical protein ABIO45_06185 [Burkholderiaceae bacterium]